MAIYATGSQFGGAAAKPKNQNAQARDYLRQEGQAAPQQNNYAGSTVRQKPTTTTPMPDRTQVVNGAATPPRTTGTGSKPVRSGVVGGRPTIAPTQPAPRAQPQVRDRAFSMSEQQYRQGGAPTQQAVLTPAPAAIGTTVTMAGPYANQPDLAGMLNNISSTSQAAMKPGGNMAFGGAMPAYTPTGQETNPVAGMSVLGADVPTQQGGAGTVQTRVDAQTPWEIAQQMYQEWNQNAQDNAAGDANENATYTGATGTQNEADASAAAAQGDAALEAELNSQYVPGDFSLANYSDTPEMPGPPGAGGGGGNQSPFTSFAEWLATMIGEPFGAAATKLNEYGRKTKDAYYNDWEDLAPLQTLGKDLMDPSKIGMYEDSARARMQTSIGQERDQAARDLMGQAGRGGAIGTGRETGINNAALRAMMEGEQRLLEDSFRRKLASQQLGAGIYGDAQRAKYGALEGGDISPGELAGIVIPAAMDMGGAAMEAIGGGMGGGPGPFPFFDLFFGG